MTRRGRWQLVALEHRHLDAVLEVEARVQFDPWSRIHFTDSLAAGHEAVVMMSGDELLGYAIVLDVLDEAHLLNIAIAPVAQRQGLGRALLSSLQQRARDDGARAFYLEVRASNLGARRLYEELGYEQIGQRKGYYAAADGREDAIVMKKAL